MGGDTGVAVGVERWKAGAGQSEKQSLKMSAPNAGTGGEARGHRDIKGPTPLIPQSGNWGRSAGSHRL